MVKKQFKKGLPDPDAMPRNGRPPILGTEQYQELVHAIYERYAERRPMSLSEVDYYVETRFHVSMNRNTLWQVLHQGPETKSCRGIPMEEAGVDVMPEMIMDFFRRAIELVDGGGGTLERGDDLRDLRHFPGRGRWCPPL
jgi:hypothetical protein